MKVRLLHDWGGFYSTCLIPTVMIGIKSYGGWAYLYWLQGRIGICWSRRLPFFEMPPA